MTTLRTRASKGSELSHNELDANFKRDVQPKTTTYACLVGDNRSVIECSHATTPFTVTLGDAATMAAAETGDYEITILNINAAVVTVARAGTDTINGAATSLTLAQWESVTLKTNNADNGYNVISRGIQQLDGWTAPSLLNSWVNYGGGQVIAGYYKDNAERVYVRGRVKDGTGASVVFTLPAGYRPAYTVYLAESGGGSLVTVDTSGNVTHYTGSSTTDYQINCSFRAA